MTEPAVNGSLAARYGNKRGRPSPGLVAGLVVLATAFTGWVVWAALGASAPEVTAQVTGFVVTGSQEIRVKVVVAADQGRVSCPIRALDKNRESVGATTLRVQVPASGRVETTVPVRTRARAVTAVLDECGLLGAG